MSRGGRGGGFGGRGGRGGGGFGGPFGGDPDDKPDYSVTELFPPVPPPVQSGLTKLERETAARFRNHREKIHNGPMYTVMAKKRGMEDPFEVERYSQKYTKVARRAPKLDARPYVAEFFPEELYPIMGIDEKTKGDVSAKKKKLAFSALDALDSLDDLEARGDDEEDDGKKPPGLVDDDAADGAEDDQPDDFSDDEDDDYNAEQYFTDGEGAEDFGDEDDGGNDDFY